MNQQRSAAVAAIQMSSVADVGRNLETALGLLRQAAAAGARLAVLPENFAFMGAHERDKLALAEADGDAQAPIQEFLAQTARRLGLWIVAGTVPLRVPGDPDRVYAACLVYDAQGRRAARYDKIHLFDVDVGDAQGSYRESATFEPGDQIVCVDTPAGRLGLSVCYDLRFAELYLALGRQGAEILSVPSAFTHRTGEAHWEVLLRARAIENQAYVIGAGQGGRHSAERETWGHSLIADPWGHLLDQCPTPGPATIVATRSATDQTQIRQRMPVQSHRKL